MAEHDADEQGTKMDEALKVSSDEAAKNDAGPEGEEPEPAAEKPEIHTSPENSGGEGKPNPFKRAWAWCLSHKKFSIPIAILLLIVLILAIPFTRYAVLGLFVKEDVAVTVQDSKSHQPISGADVTLQGVAGKTDNHGQAKLHVKVGPGTVKATKKYYSDASANTTVTLSSSKNTVTLPMQATGRQVPVIVDNKITGKPLENATIKAAGTTATTDKNGKAIIVLPADKDTQDATISADGYNNLAVKIKVMETDDPANAFLLTPAGTVYFISKATGKLDVVKTDLDGGNRKTVLAGTGKEDDGGTVLVASRDWKYLALEAKRDSDKPKLYLISTADDKLTTMDEGDAYFTLYGWANDTFVYTVDRNTVPLGQAKKYALKSYNAQAQKLTTIDESQAETVNPTSVFYTSYNSVYLFDSQILFNTIINSVYYNSATAASSFQMTVNTVNTDGSGKKVANSLPGTTSAGAPYYMQTFLTKPQVIYYDVSAVGGADVYYTWDHGTFKKTDDNDNIYNTIYPIYYESPSGKQTFWYEARDGKNAMFIGDQDGAGGKQITSISDLVSHGWFTDQYLLLSKNDSELYIMGVDGTTPPVKISDYHKPGEGYPRYGGGY